MQNILYYTYNNTLWDWNGSLVLIEFLSFWEVSLLKPKNENMILPNGLNFDGVKYPTALKIICCSVWIVNAQFILRICPVRSVPLVLANIPIIFNMVNVLKYTKVSDKIASLGGSVLPSDWRPGSRGFNPLRGWQHSFMEIDHEIFSMVVLALPLIQEGQLSVSGERMSTILVNRLED